MKVFVDTIGCRLNQSEIEKMAAQFSARGHTLVQAAEEADIAVINTCAVTGKAVADSRRSIRKALSNGHTRVISTGCWATLNPEEIFAIGENLEVVNNLHKEEIVDWVLGNPETGMEISGRVPLPGDRFRTRAFIKVQEGCDQHCTFCVTRLARGRSRSVPAQDVLADIEWALSGGVKEVVLTGVNLGSWGKDLVPASQLGTLIRTILRTADLPRLRLSSLEPWDLDEDFFKLWKNEKMCRHLHLPLQSGSDAVLKRMGRSTSQQGFAKLVEYARNVSPEIAISTDIIVGFPGETDKQFEESMEFVQRMQFASGHVFTFSPRPGTAAARLPEAIPEAVKKQRSKQMRNLIQTSSCKYRQQFIGGVVNALWESCTRINQNSWELHGLSDNYLRVTAQSSSNRWNQIDMVKLLRCEDGKIIASIFD